MFRKRLRCLMFAVGGVALTASTGVDAVTTAAVAGSLLSGAAGNIFHELFGADEDRLVAAIFRRHPGIDENHHILLALRQAHLTVLDAVLATFDESRASDPDPTRRLEGERFSREMRRFLKEAGLGRETRAGEATDLEKSVFAKLPEAFDAALAARGPSPAGTALDDAKASRRDIEAAVLAELLEETNTPEAELPPLFRSAFARQPGWSWFDLFVREAASRLKANEAFRSIWTAEKIARIAHVTDGIAGTLGEITDQLARVRDDLAQSKQELLDAITAAADKGVSRASLSEVLKKLGEADIPPAEIPARLNEAAEELIRLRAELARLRNDRPEFAAIRTRALALIDKGAFGAARAELARGRETARALREEISRSEAEFLIDEARVEQLQLNYDEACAKFAEAGRLDPDNCWMWIELGDLWVMRGSLAKAENAFREAAEAARRNGDERDLSVSHSMIGDVQVAQGALPIALKSYRAGLAIAERLAGSDPGNAGGQRDLSVSYNKIGDVQVAQGALPDALQSYRDGLAISERLAGSDPGNAGWQRDLSVSYNKIGDVQVTQGALPAALQSYRAGLAISERLAGSDPGNAGWQRDLSVSYNKIGDVQVAQGSLPAALKSYRADLAIAERLAGSDPGNAQWQHDLFVSYDRIGNVQVTQGAVPAALKSYRDGLAIAERLAGSDPGNAGWQRDLSISYNRIGDVQVAQGALPVALKSYCDGLAIRKRLVGSDPSNAGWQRNLSVSYDRIGDVQVMQGALPAALQSYRDGLAIAERLAGSDPGNAEWQRDLSISYDRIGDVQVEQGALPAALKSYRDGLAIRERLAGSDPGNAEWQRDLAASYGKLGRCLRTAGKREEASEAFKAGRAVIVPLVEQFPDWAQWKRDLTAFDRDIASVNG